MKKSRLLVVVALLIGCLLSIPASAATINLFASIDGNQVVPSSTGSPGTGTGIMTYDDITNLLSWNITYSGLIGTPTVSHFHGAALAGSNAGVQVDIAANSGGIASPMIGSATISEPQEADLLAELWYINIHTDNFPAGEIRGQVEVVPVPAAVWLFGSGLLGLIGIARRKKAA